MSDVTYNSVTASTISVRALTVTSTFRTAETSYEAFSIPWNAMQSVGGIILEDGLWIHKGVLSTAQHLTSSFTAQSATINNLTTNSINPLRLSTVYAEISTLAVKHYLDATQASASFGSLTTNVFTTDSFNVSTLTVYDLKATNQSFDAIGATTFNIKDADTLLDYPLITSSQSLFFNSQQMATKSYADSIGTNATSYTSQVATNLNEASNILQTNINTLSTSITTDLGSSGYISTQTLTSSLTGLGNIGYISSSQLTSSLEGLGSLNYISSSQLTSSLEGLGDFGYISSSQLQSTVITLGTLGYISTQSLTSSLNGLGSLGYLSSFDSAGSAGYISSQSLTSSLEGLGSLNYISSSQLTSSLEGLGNLNYISSSQLQSTITHLGSLNYISSSQLTSSLEGLGSLNYISSSQLTSSLNGLGSLNYISSSQLESTITHLGSLNYISSSQLTSTVNSLGNLNYISSSQLTSSLIGLGSLNYISSSQLESTIINLGSIGYVSSQTLTSSLNGLGSLDYISSSQLTSSLAGLGSLTYISSQTLTSTVTGLGSLNYVSSSQLTSTVNGLGSLGYISSLAGLGSLGYISSQTLTSTLEGLSSSVYLNNIVQSTATFSTLSTTNINFSPASFTLSSFFVAVGSNSDSKNSILYSDSLLTYTNGSNSFTSQGLRVATNGQGFFVAAGSNSTNTYGETLKWSVDGISWTPAISGAFSNYANSLFYNGSNLWIAGGDSTGLHKYSYDGKNWLDGTSAFAANNPNIPYGIAYNGSNLYVATGLSNTNVNQSLQWSSDGINWNLATSGSIAARGVAFGQRASDNTPIWVAAGSNLIVYSTDGKTWSPVTTTFDTNFNFLGATFGNGTFIVSGRPYPVAAPGSIQRSTDGLTWTASLNGGGSNMYSPRYITSSIFAIAGVGSNSASNIQYSLNNGSNWSPITTFPPSGPVYDIIGKYISTTQNPPTTLFQNASGSLQTSTSVLSLKPQSFRGNTLVVDSVYGNDAAAQYDSSYPFQTISTALSYFGPYKELIINPGFYSISQPIYLPNYGTIKGTSQTYLTFSTLTTSITCFTMGNYSSVDSLNVTLTSDSNLNFTGFLFPDSTPLTATVKNCSFTLNNSNVATEANNTLIGVYVTGNASCPPTTNFLQNTTLILHGNGNGNVYGIQSVGGSNFIQSVNINISEPRDSISAGFYTALMTNNASCILTTRNTTINVSSNAGGSYFAQDIYPVAGSIVFGPGTDLVNRYTGGSPFTTTFPLPQVNYLGLGALSNTNISTAYLAPGTLSTFYLPSSPVQYLIDKKVILQSLITSLTTPPTNTNTTTITVYKNNSATPMQVSYTGNQSSFTVFSTTTLSLKPNDLISINVERLGGTNASSDVSARLSFF